MEYFLQSHSCEFPPKLSFLKWNFIFFFLFVCMHVSTYVEIGLQLSVFSFHHVGLHYRTTYVVRIRAKCFICWTITYAPNLIFKYLIPGPAVSPFLSTKRLMAKMLSLTSSCYDVFLSPKKVDQATIHWSPCNQKPKQIFPPSHLLLDICHSKQSPTNTNINMPTSSQGRILLVMFEILKKYVFLDLEDGTAVYLLGLGSSLSPGGLMLLVLSKSGLFHFMPLSFFQHN